jgi:hypothetical protein
MKLNQLITDFSISVSNEETKILELMDKDIRAFESFNEREQFIIEGLIRKSLVSKVYNKGSILVVANDNIYEK